MVIHNIKIREGASKAPNTNSRTVLPLEILAINIPTKGEKAIHQDQ